MFQPCSTRWQRLRFRRPTSRTDSLVLRGQQNVDVVLAGVDAIDVAAKEIVLDEDAGRLPYDYLILAAGANHAYFGHDEWAPNAPGLKTLEDALDIRRRLLMSFEEAEREPDPARRQALMTFVVVGGGPTGVEMAGAIAEIARFSLARDFRHIDTRDAKVILIEAPTPLRVSRPALPALRDLKRLGVDVRFGQPVTAIASERGHRWRRDHPREHNHLGRGGAVVPQDAHLVLSSTARGECSSTRTSPSLAIPRSSSSATWPRSRMRGAGRCRVWRRWRCSRERGRRRTS